jgi:glycosyltransferase involved in cell wall biosynthesis
MIGVQSGSVSATAYVEEPLHICHIVLRLDVGGLERIVLDLIHAGRRDGHRVSVLCLERPGVLAPVAVDLGAHVVSAGKRLGLRPRVVSRIGTILRRLRPDVIHTHQIGALLYAGPAARSIHVPVVHTEHGKHYANRLRNRLLGRLAARAARRICAVSLDVLHELRDCGIAPPRKLVHVPNGVDPERFTVSDDIGTLRQEFDVPARVPVIGTVGRLTGLKRQDILLRGFTSVGHPTARLLLVGDGPARRELEALATSLGVIDRVRFAGYCARPERALAALDIFALTSDSEGMPLAILEAWAAGKPVVASGVGGVPDLIDDGRTGLLFRPRDVAALAGCLERLLHDQRLAQALGAAGRELVRARYDTRAMAAKYLGLYRELIQSTVWA